jgi:hypothetical protein
LLCKDRRRRDEIAKPHWWFVFAECGSSDTWTTQSTANEGKYGENDENEEEDLRSIVRQPRYHAEAKEGGD